MPEEENSPRIEGSQWRPELRRSNDIAIVRTMIQNTGRTTWPFPDPDDRTPVEIRSDDLRDLYILIIEAKGWDA